MPPASVLLDHSVNSSPNLGVQCRVCHRKTASVACQLNACEQLERFRVVDRLADVSSHRHKPTAPTFSDHEITSPFSTEPSTTKLPRFSAWTSDNYEQSESGVRWRQTLLVAPTSLNTVKILPVLAWRITARVQVNKFHKQEWSLNAHRRETSVQRSLV
jgi:hypothetical protein